MKPPGKLSSVILWSVISAAFIGPGTVTTAFSVGAQFKFDLVWAIVFATIACIVLQEISARIVIASGLTLGQLLKKKFGDQTGKFLQLLLGGSVILGCAAYEAGNILGAVSGLSLLVPGYRSLITVLICIVGFGILWIGGNKWISRVMILLVVLMGAAFVALAGTREIPWSGVVSALSTPTIPAGAQLLVLGLIGTTIVPYNIFIGSGISKGQTIPLMRIGLIISITIGGLITCAIMFAGSTVDVFDSFTGLARTFETRLGTWSVWALALGLFAAGFSSSITAPFASSVIASTVFGFEKQSHIRMVWGVVLLTGFVFGVSDVKPIPVILAVQVLNGFILPLLVLYLILMINDHTLIPSSFRHSMGYNLILVAILSVVFLIGLNNVDKAVSSMLQIEANHFGLIVFVTFMVVSYTVFRIIRDRKVL
jgi:manganese transport protein